MQIEQVKKLTDETLERLAKELEQGKSDAMNKYLAAMARFHHYSFGNILLIYCQRPDATNVAGFQSWKKFGRFVRKGEKGIVILAPMLIRVNDDVESENENSVESEKTSDKKALRFRAVYVFDVSQTEGDELPEPPHVGGDPGDFIDRVKSLITSKGIELEYSPIIGGAEGCSTGGRIIIRPDLSTAQEFAVLVHELAHELLHKENREGTTKTSRELEAEAVAFVVSQAIGLDTNTACSDYIKLYNGNTETLAASLDRIQQTSAEIIEALSRDTVGVTVDAVRTITHS